MKKIIIAAALAIILSGCGQTMTRDQTLGVMKACAELNLASRVVYAGLFSENIYAVKCYALTGLEK